MLFVEKYTYLLFVRLHAHFFGLVRLLNVQNYSLTYMPKKYAHKNQHMLKQRMVTFLFYLT